MKTHIKISSLFILFILLGSCSKATKADAYGNFEAPEITVSAQANGQLLRFKIDEGDIKKTASCGLYRYHSVIS